MHRIEIHSRRGSLALGVIGVIDVVCAVATLFIYIVKSWDAASSLDRLLQLTLIASAVGGLYLFFVGVENLGIRRQPLLRRAIPGRRASAAASS
jgi:hypothetical protein